MQTVAKFQFVSSTDISGAAARLAQVIERWGKEKFAQDSSGSTVIRHSGVSAVFDRRGRVQGSSKEVAFDVLEPVVGGQLQTQVKFLETAAALHVQCTLSLGSDSGLLPPHVDIYSPRFIRNIISKGKEWRVTANAERVFAKCFTVETKDVETLRDLIFAPQRRLPLIVLSEFQGETLASNAHERVSADTCGLAHTCRITEKATWELTHLSGKEWSCYNGAIRLFWPLSLSRDDFRVHPLWTRDFLLRGANSEAFALERFRHVLMERLLEASTFVADDPAFARFEAERAYADHEAERAKVGGDYRALAESYAAENDGLRNALGSAQVEVETLQQRIETLLIALRSRERAEAKETSQESPPETVADAVAMAKTELSGIVAFGRDVDGQIENLNSSAGPPEKILRYLRTLGDMSRALQEGPLGKSVPIWLRDQNIECSGESETIKKNKAAHARRTFNINGQDLYCEYHAKPSDGVAPDFCVRIYFAVENKVPRVRVGYIGRHFD